MELIDKDALVAEVKNLIDGIYAGRPFNSLSSEQQTSLWYVKSIMSSIDTLEVKEVDLDKEIDLVEDKYRGFESLSKADIIDIAKHFYELGHTSEELYNKMLEQSK